MFNAIQGRQTILREFVANLLEEMKSEQLENEVEADVDGVVHAASQFVTRPRIIVLGG